ncbi:hypothetical protein BHE74_00010871, partial [Ensete ventricosum]
VKRRGAGDAECERRSRRCRLGDLHRGRRRGRDLSDSSNPFVDGALPTTALASAKSRFPPILGFRVSNLFLVSSFIAPLAVRARDLICAIGLSVEDHAADGCSG